MDHETGQHPHTYSCLQNLTYYQLKVPYYMDDSPGHTNAFVQVGRTRSTSFPAAAKQIQGHVLGQAPENHIREHSRLIVLTILIIN